MAKASRKEVAVRDDKPAYLQKLEQKGPVQSRDNFDSTDITLPRVKLLQGLSAECESYDDAKPGVLWHTGLDMLLGQEVEFVAVSRRKRYLLVAPIEDGQGILARSEDFIHWVPPSGSFDVKFKDVKKPVTWKLAPTVAESGLDRWGSSKPDDPQSPPAATMFYEYLVLLTDHLDVGPVVLSLTRSQVKKAKKGLNDKIKLHESAGRPMQSLVFCAKVTKEEGPSGAFFNFQFHSAGFAPEKIYNMAWDMKDTLTTYKTQDEVGAATEQETTTKSAF